MKIGIGVTTYQREECLQNFLKALKQFPPKSEYIFHVAKDIPNIAKAKNECLNALKECDYIFLFDDDTFPKQAEWDVPFIESGQAYSLYMNESYGVVQEMYDLTRYHDCSGCFMFLTKEIFEKVGYFNSAYGRYGYEHLGYFQRIKKLTSDWGFICLNATKNFIHSFDLDGTRGFNTYHAPTIDFEERILLSDMNYPIYEKEVGGDKIYFEYE
ncbi:MAG: hypothetical protein V4547_17980 [Bacteroidota bacterium]